MELDQMIETLVSDAQIEHGCPAAWLEARDMVVRPAVASKSQYPQRWTEAEDQFYLEHIGHMSYEEIAAALGRSVTGVVIRARRKGLPKATRMFGYLSANQVAILLGIDNHKPPAWIDAGIMPGERIASEEGIIRRVSLVQFKMWLIRPKSWVYFRVTRIKNEYLRRLVQLAQSRWGDEWLTTKQAADLRGCTVQDILQQIVNGKLVGYQPPLVSGRHFNRRWAYWFVRKSHVLRVQIVKGKGGPGHPDFAWSTRADAFLLRARAEGKSYYEIGRMMKWHWQRVRYRLQCLEREGKSK